MYCLFILKTRLLIVISGELSILKYNSEKNTYQKYHYFFIKIYKPIIWQVGHISRQKYKLMKIESKIRSSYIQLQHIE